MIVPDAVIPVDKPINWTSFDVVKYIRKALGNKIKVGHAGTLDPLATGLVLVCTGSKTKTIEQLMGQTKEYTGEIVLGATTPSYDLETPIDAHYPTDHITRALIDSKISGFLGEIDQLPPVFSAKKIEGKPAYLLARADQPVPVKVCRVRIDAFEVLEYADQVIHFRLVCGKGTYVRSLAFDLGKALGSGAYLRNLRRTRIGDYAVESAFQIPSKS